MKINESAKQLRSTTKEQYAASFGSNLKAAMKTSEKCSTIRELSEMIKVSPNSIGAYINGNTLPTMASALMIADTLGLSLDALFGRDTSFSSISKEPTIAELARNLMAMDDADVIDIRTPLHKGEPYQLFILNQKVNDFIKQYIYMSQRVRHDGKEGQAVFDAWLSSQLESLRQCKTRLGESIV